MSTTTLYPNADGTLNGNWTATGSANKWDTIDEGTASPNDSDYLSCDEENENGFVQLTNMPSDTDTVTACAVKLRLSVGKLGDYIRWSTGQIVGSDESTALTASFSLSGASNTITTFTFNPTVSVSDKTSWDGARLKLTTGSGTTNSAKIYAAQVELTYTPTSSGETYNETGSGGCVSGGTAHVLKGSLFSNLSAFWKLEETSGTRLDETENNNDLTDTNSVSYSSAKVGNGATFVSSSNQHLSIADNSTINLGSTDFSISLWVKFSALTNNGANDYIGIISKGSGGASYAFSMQYRPSNSQLQIQFYNGGTTYTLWASSFGSFSTGVWYHIITTYTNSSKATTLSVNGTQNSGTSSIAVVDSAYGLSLGRGYYSNTYNSSCTIDAVGLWKRVLTTNEKAKLFRLGHGNEYPFENSFNETIEGGAVGGSSAIVSLSQTLETEGGIVCGGITDETESETKIAEGGAEIGGSAVISHDVYPLGGIVCDGSATVELIRKGLEISGKSFWHIQLPCSGEISIQMNYFAGLIQSVFQNMGEDYEVHIFDDLSLPDEVTSESDFNTWEFFVKEAEEFTATATENEIVLDAGISPHYEFVDDDSKVVTGWAVVGETSRRVYWANFHGIRTISNSNTSEFFVRLKFRRGL